MGVATRKVTSLEVQPYPRITPRQVALRSNERFCISPFDSLHNVPNFLQGIVTHYILILIITLFFIKCNQLFFKKQQIGGNFNCFSTQLRKAAPNKAYIIVSKRNLSMNSLFPRAVQTWLRKARSCLRPVVVSFFVLVSTHH